MTLPLTLAAGLAMIADALLVWGWLLVFVLTLWIAWEVYRYLKRVDYTASINWTYFQVTVPEDAAQTPKAFENAVEVWGGVHKDPDLIEKWFEGYMLPWYSCELQCSKGIARYILVVPTQHARFFEGVLYGQYPTAEIREVADYAQEFSYQDIGKTYEIWGSEIVLAKDDYYPVRTYREFEDALAEDDRYVDPHQALVEAFTNINEGEHFWVQVLIKPIDAKEIQQWADAGQEKISELAGQEKKTAPSIVGAVWSVLTALPGELWKAFLSGPAEAEKKDAERIIRPVYNPAEDALMKGILQKVSRTGFKTKIRVIHIAPKGKLLKANYGKAIGAFKQFNSFQLNSLKPDSNTKTNGPNYVLKATRRAYRMRSILVNYQWRDFWGDRSGDMMTAEELATIYHLPVKYVRSPSVERAAAGRGSPPVNVPYT